MLTQDNPTIINPSSTPTIVSIPEGQTIVVDIDTIDDTDFEGSGLTYSLTGGADEDLFSINSLGLLTFDNPPNFEAPDDADEDNNYEVQVTVTDSDGLTDVQDLTVIVADLNEDPGSLDLIQPDPDIAATFIGPTGISTDGLGTSDSGLLQADIPAGSTIEAAYLHVATRTPNVSFRPDTISFDDQLVDITWLENVGDASVLNFETGRADVTSIVSDRVGLGGGLFDFAVDETTTGQPEFIEGTSLSVIYSNPSLPERSIFLLEGGLTGPTPQTNTVFLADPIDKSDPDFIAQLALGIQFGFVRGTLPDLQFSEVDINGVRLTSSAGDFDDGSASNGALITVGGVGDSLDNPIDPFDNLASDDELYDLTDFLNDGDSSIQIDTANPSNDDSIFLVALTLPGNATILPNEPPTIIIPDTTPATVSIPSGQTDVIDIETTDDLDIEGEGLTYSLTGIDALLFDLDNETGELTFVNPPDFENPEDADGDNNYEVQVTVTDSGGLSDLVDLTVNIDQNDPPIIISPDTANVLENTTLVIDVMSLDDNDSEGLGLTYDIIGGADSALFEIDPITGIVEFELAPDFENPLDINTDNNYELEIEVADSQGLSATQVLTVTVTNNLPPDAVDNIYALNGEPSIGGNLISDNTGDGVDSDPEGDLFTVTANSQPLAGSVSIDANGSFTYTPDLDEFSDSDSFTYTITDSDGGTDTANVTINDSNTGPIANDDEDTTDEDTLVTTAV
ncbi:MAG: Ig-like domain-containing protein, partial [Cyanobacteria bacterium J06638_38]